MRIVMGIVISLMLVMPVGAAEYTSKGRVVPTGYDGPGFTMEDAAYIGGYVTTVTTLWVCDVSKGLSGTITALGPILYGAWRVEQYRPYEVKKQIAMNLAVRDLQPVAGSVWEVLGR